MNFYILGVGTGFSQGPGRIQSISDLRFALMLSIDPGLGEPRVQNLKLDSLRIDARFDDLPNRVKSEHLKQTARNLVSNLQRAVAFGSFGPLLTHWMFEIGKCVAEVHHRNTGFYISDKRYENDIAKRRIINFDIIKRLDEMVAEAPSDYRLLPDFSWKRAISNMKTLDHRLGGSLSLATDSILAGMVTGTCTAFEIAAEELWEAGTNAFPNILIEKRSVTSRDEHSKKPIGNDITIDAAELLRVGFTLSGRIGSIFKSDYKFISYDKISFAYIQAFGETFGSLRTEKN